MTTCSAQSYCTPAADGIPLADISNAPNCGSDPAGRNSTLLNLNETRQDVPGLNLLLWESRSSPGRDSSRFHIACFGIVLKTL
jgi:hypothetical protein